MSHPVAVIIACAVGIVLIRVTMDIREKANNKYNGRNKK
ncbi:hypothetical protein 278BB001_93 [Bacillus phage 278BB001]|nr:hypothetical protein 278BB001_93 [Bacillus phage 278BB001]